MAAEKKLPVVGVGLSEEDVALMERLAGSRIFRPRRIILLSAANWRTESEHLFCNAAGAVSMRYHFALLALLSGVPLSLSAYDPKVEEFAAEWKLPVWKGGAPPYRSFRRNRRRPSTGRISSSKNSPDVAGSPAARTERGLAVQADVGTPAEHASAVGGLVG